MVRGRTNAGGDHSWRWILGGDWVDWREDRRAGLKVWPVYSGRARMSVGMLVQWWTVGAREWRIEGSVGCWDRVRRGGAGWITLKCASIGGTGQGYR